MKAQPKRSETSHEGPAVSVEVASPPHDTGSGGTRYRSLWARRLAEKGVEPGTAHGKRVWRGVRLTDRSGPAFDDESENVGGDDDGDQRGSDGITISQNSSHENSQEKVWAKGDPRRSPVIPEPSSGNPDRSDPADAELSDDEYLDQFSPRNSRDEG